MTYRELFYKATRLIDKGEITLGEYDEMTKPLNRDIEQQPCERFEWGIDGNVYKITKAKDGKEICQQVCNDAISRDMALEKMADYVASGYADSAEDFEEYSRIICQLPSVTPTCEEREKGECPYYAG